MKQWIRAVNWPPLTGPTTHWWIPSWTNVRRNINLAAFARTDGCWRRGCFSAAWVQVQVQHLASRCSGVPSKSFSSHVTSNNQFPINSNSVFNWFGKGTRVDVLFCSFKWRSFLDAGASFHGQTGFQTEPWGVLHRYWWGGNRDVWVRVMFAASKSITELKLKVDRKREASSCGVGRQKLTHLERL